MSVEQNMMKKPVEDGTEPLVSIVVLNYNGSDVLEMCIRSVLNINYSNFEVIVVDNNSVDGSFESCKRVFGGDPRITFISNSANLGFAEGNNVGARVAKGKYIVFLNNDNQVKPDWLKELINVMESDSSVGACESKVLMMNDPTMVCYSGGINDYFGFLVQNLPEKDRGQYEEAKEIFVPVGVSVAVRSSVLKEVGLFDSQFFIHNEIRDLNWRIRLGGYKVLWVPKSITLHAARLCNFSKKYDNELMLKCAFHGVKNHYAMLIKNYCLKNVVKYVPVIVFLRLMEILYLLATGRSKFALVKIKAIVWVLRHLDHIWRERMRVQLYVRRVPDDQITKFMTSPNFTYLLRNIKQLGDKYEE